MSKSGNANEQSEVGVPVRNWGWEEAIFVQLAALTLGFLLQIARIHLPLTVPWNWIIPAFLFIGAGVTGVCFRNRMWMRWMSGIRFAVSITILVAIIGALGTVILQTPDKADVLTRLGFRTLFTSPPFVAVILLMAINLSAATGRRLATPRPGNLAFVLNHAGLLLVILGMIAGAAQFTRMTLRLQEEQFTTEGTDESGNVRQLPGTVSLTKFVIEKFPPKLAAAESVAGKPDQTIVDQDWVAAGRHFHAFGMTVSVDKFLPVAMPDDQGGWTPSDHHGLPAALVTISALNGTQQHKWLTPAIASLQIQAQVAYVDNTHIVGLLEPQPKAFRSSLVITPKDHPAINAELAVNQPVRLGDWQLYQNSYELTMMGRTSIIEAIRDPALPVVYTGFASMFLGAFLAFWFAPIRRKDQTGTEEQA